MVSQEIKLKIAEILGKHGVLVGYIFGSAARDLMGPHSDIDLAVFFNDKQVPEEKRFDEKLAISQDITKVFEVEDADIIDLGVVSDPLIKYVAVFSGELIFDKDKNRRFALERKIVRDYENTRKLRSIASSIMKKQLNDGSFGRALVIK